MDDKNRLEMIKKIAEGIKTADDRKAKIEMIKMMARQSLEIWEKERQELIEEANRVNEQLTDEDKRGAASMKALFQVADQLTSAVMSAMDIESPITPEVVSVISAMVLGITNAQGAKEVEKLISLRIQARNMCQSSH